MSLEPLEGSKSIEIYLLAALRVFFGMYMGEKINDEKQSFTFSCEVIGHDVWLFPTCISTLNTTGTFSLETRAYSHRLKAK